MYIAAAFPRVLDVDRLLPGAYAVDAQDRHEDLLVHRAIRPVAVQDDRGPFPIAPATADPDPGRNHPSPSVEQDHRPLPHVRLDVPLYLAQRLGVDDRAHLAGPRPAPDFDFSITLRSSTNPREPPS